MTDDFETDTCGTENQYDNLNELEIECYAAGSDENRYGGQGCGGCFLLPLMIFLFTFFGLLTLL